MIYVSLKIHKAGANLEQILFFCMSQFKHSLISGFLVKGVQIPSAAAASLFDLLKVSRLCCDLGLGDGERFPFPSTLCVRCLTFTILCNPLSPHDRGPIILTLWKQKLGQVQAPARACTAAGMTARQSAGLATAQGTMGMSQLITGHPDARRPRCRGFWFALHINPKTPNRRFSIFC